MPKWSLLSLGSVNAPDIYRLFPGSALVYSNEMTFSYDRSWCGQARPRVSKRTVPNYVTLSDVKS